MRDDLHQPDLHQPRYLSPAEAAARVGVTERYLAHLRHSRRGPAYYTLGHRTVRYRVADVDAWMASTEEKQGAS